MATFHDAFGVEESRGGVTHGGVTCAGVDLVGGDRGGSGADRGHSAGGHRFLTGATLIVINNMRPD